MNKLLLIPMIFMLAIGNAYATTVTAFKTGERVTGNTKQCYYAFGGNQYTHTIRSYELCPLSIEVEL